MQIAHAVEVRDRVLGPREERSRHMPVRSSAGRIGGTRFERDFPPNGNVRDGRCYPYGTSFETFTKIYAPCAQSKASRATKDVMLYRSDLLEASIPPCICPRLLLTALQVTLDMATKSLMSGPNEVSAGLTLNHELLNLPSAGVATNSFFGANQLNLAPAEEYDSGLCSTLLAYTIFLCSNRLYAIQYLLSRPRLVALAQPTLIPWIVLPILQT